MKRLQRLLFGALAVLLTVAALSAAPVLSRAAGFSSDWLFWSQGDSKYGAVQSSGCRIVAQAKLLAEAGILEAGTTPDDYYDWMVKNGWILGSIAEKWGNGGPYSSGTGSSILDYAAKHGSEVLRVGAFTLPADPADREAKVKSYIDQGYYVILDSVTNGTHQTYVSRELSLAYGTPWITDSFSAGYSVSFKNGIFAYTGSAHGIEKNYTTAYVYSVPVTEPPVTYLEDNAYFVNEDAEVTSTGAAVRAVLRYITPSKAVVEVGVKVGTSMEELLFCERVTSENGFIDGAAIEFSLGELSPDTTYYYAFYAKSEVDSEDETQIAWSPLGSFATDPVFSVSYDVGAGTDAPEAQVKTPNVDLILTEQTPLREGYRFLGWSTAENAKVAEYHPGDSFAENIDLVLYAVWELPGDLNDDSEITDTDAVYLLYSLYYPEDYPVTQSADYNGDGSVSDRDALYLLLHIFYPDEYPLLP